MRKRGQRRPRPQSAPILVSRGLCNDEIEMRERQIIEAFKGGWATTGHFDALANMRNVTLIAAAYKDDQDTIRVCNALHVLTMNLRDRYTQTGRMGLSGEEIKFLTVFVDYYRDFWIRQPMKLFELALRESNLLLGLKNDQPEPQAA